MSYETEHLLNDSKKDKRNAHQNLLDDVKHVLDTIQGRRVLYHLLSEAGIYRVSFDASNACITAYNEGRRKTGLQLLELLEEANEGLFSQMINENRTNRNGPRSKHTSNN
jgi:hypothetical protein